MSPDRKFALRFWEKVDRSGDCWMWTGAKIKGYGSIGTGSHCTELAHRVSWRLENGPIPAGKHVLHRCDTPACVRPSHLFIGDQRSNVADMISKGRQEKGENRWNAKLTAADVATIRSRVLAGESRASVARAIGLSRSLVSLVADGKRWRHVS